MVSDQCGAAALAKVLSLKGLLNFTGVAQRGFCFARTYSDQGQKLQAFLNSTLGCALVEDGVAAEKTSDVVKEAFGHYLTGDPRC